MIRFRMTEFRPTARARSGLVGLLALLVLAGVACTQQPTTATPAPAAASPPRSPVAASPVASPAVSPRPAVSPSPAPRVVVASPSPSPSPRPAVSPSPVALRGEIVVTANRDDRNLSVIETGTARVATTINLSRPPHAVALTPDARFAFATDRSQGSQAVVVADLTRTQQIGELTVGAQPDGIAIPIRGGPGVVANSGDDSVHTFDPATRTPAGPVAVGDQPNGIGLMRLDGALQAFVANQGAGTVSVVDVEGRRVVATIMVGGRPTEVTTAADANRVFVLDAETGGVVVLDALTRQMVTTIRVGANLTGLDTTADGRFLFVTADDPSRNLYQIDLATNQVLQDFNAGAGALAVVAGLEPGRVYVTTTDNRLVFWDVDARRATTTVPVGRRPEGLAVGRIPVPAAPAPSPAAPSPAAPAPSPRPAVSPSPAAGGAPGAPGAAPVGAPGPGVPTTPMTPAASPAAPAASPGTR